MNILKTTFVAASAAFLMSSASFAADIMIKDAYARSATKISKSGAAFMVIENHAMAEDRLIEARSDIAKKVELHTHMKTDEGVMRMMHVPEGFVIPSHGSHALARGADHVMFMGLNAPMFQGDTFTLTLVFENAGEIEVTVPVDLERQDGMMMKMDNSHDHDS